MILLICYIFIFIILDYKIGFADKLILENLAL